MESVNNMSVNLSQRRSLMIRQEIVMEVYKILICEHCANYCHPPFNQSIEGHLTCAVCFKKQWCCHSCAGNKTSARVFVLEKIYLELKFRCKYNGCEFQEKGKLLKNHYKECEYFSEFCPHNFCTWRGKTKDLFDHYRESHPLCLPFDDPDKKLTVAIHRGENRFRTSHVIMIFGRIISLGIIMNHSTKQFGFSAINIESLENEEFTIQIDFFLNDGRKTVATFKTISYRNGNRVDAKKYCRANLTYDDISENYTLHVLKF